MDDAQTSVLTRMPNDPLEAFYRKFMASTVLGHVPVDGAVWHIGSVTSVRMFKLAPFQVQLFIMPPNYIIPAHTHPNVDSIEVYLGGDIAFTRNGEWTDKDGLYKEADALGCSKYRGAAIRVQPHDRHGGVTGASGAVFLSVQMWLNGVDPHCVAADYSGPVMCAEHLAAVKDGEPLAADQHALVPEDAL